MVIWSLILLLLSAGTSGVRPPECIWSVESTGVTPSAKEGLGVICHLRTLTPQLLDPELGNASLSALNHAAHITALTLKCARQVVFKSEVKSGMFTHFPRLEDLTLLNCKLTSLPDHFLSGLPHLRRLSIRAHHEDWPGAALQLEANAISDLPRLEVLNLSYNNLWGLPSGNLCHLPSLTSLNLTHNSLHDLGDLRLGAGGGCSHPILHLHLDHNQINEVRERGLDGASNLRLLSLSHNGMSHLADSAFEGLFEIRHLDLSMNSLVALPQSAFKDLRQLRDLNLANNSLTGLPPNVFESLSHLLTLNLSRNQLDLSPINEKPFLGLIRLVILDISFNELAYIGSNTFKDLYSLQVLHLSYNKITHLEDNTFSALANLHTLELSNNKLSALTSNGLRGLSVLTYLTLDGNSISKIHTNAFDNCSSLQQIDLSRNAFTDIPMAIKKISLLRSLDLSRNKIKVLSSTGFDGLIHLTNLYINHNLLSNLTFNSFKDMRSLKILDVSNNSISEVQNGTLNRTPFLNGLNISYNKFKSLYGTVMSLQNLTWLNASHNQIEWFDYAVIPPNLKWIDISYNSLEEIGNHYKLEDEINLKYVYASFNNITEINGPSIPNKVEEIYLDNNLIDYVSSNTFRDKKVMSIIDLSYNRLTLIGDASIRLPSKSGESHSPYPTLYLTGNMLECDCGAEWLLRSANEGGGHNPVGGSILPRLGDVTNVKCKLPGIWDNAIIPVVTVEPQQFLCTYRRHCFPVCHCCEFDACDCEQTCPRNCTCYHDHTWTHNIVDCGKGGWSMMPSGVPMDVTEAFMDGNDIGSLTSHALIGRKNLRTLYLNNSQITNIQNRTFNGLKNLLMLRLSGNLIEKLHGYEFIHLHNLLELHLDNNRLTHLGNVTFSPLRSLEVLKLNHNRLSTFPVWNLALNPFLLEVSLSINPWSCECNFLANMRAWLEANRIKTINGSMIKCFHNKSGEEGPPILSDSPVRCDHYVASNNIDNLIVHDYVMLLTISISLILLLMCGAFIAIAYRRRLKLWAVTRYGKRLFEKSSTYVEDREKLFDAFICHSAKDSAWVCGLLAPELEARGYRLCVAHRDCTVPSAPITSQAISESISCSRRVIMVLSKGFIDGEWCRYEFKSAHMEALRSIKRKHLIIIILEELPRSEFDTELNTIVRSTNSALNPRDPRFWERLRRALPSLRHKTRHRSTNGLNKTVSHPLVSTEPQTGSAWHLSETKTIPRVSSQSLTVNPYWETAVTSNIHDGGWLPQEGSTIAKPTWITQIQCSPKTPSRENESKEGDHTYMSMSECGETPSAILSGAKNIPINNLLISSNKTLPPPALYQEQLADGRLLDVRLANGGPGTLQPRSTTITTPIFTKDGPDYLTRSWIFHHPQDQNQPPPGQTYFV
ncbi:UNVERIFIED_CONTAM: hypothetical protein GTU68_004933 [Idotea baltica]|nr:hypothetical protein [Idotea baltica]